MSDDTAKPDEPPEDPADAEGPETTDEAEGSALSKGLAGKLAAHMKWIVIAAGVVVIGSIGAALYFTGVFSPSKPHEVTVALPGEAVFHEIPRLTVDLKPSDRRARPFIRVQMQAELQGESAKQAFIANEARILDAMQAHLRGLTAEELQGELGTEQLRHDFTTIINRIIAPEHAITVLYKEILVR